MKTLKALEIKERTKQVKNITETLKGFASKGINANVQARAIDLLETIWKDSKGNV